MGRVEEHRVRKDPRLCWGRFLPKSSTRSCFRKECRSLIRARSSSESDMWVLKRINRKTATGPPKQATAQASWKRWTEDPPPWSENSEAPELGCSMRQRRYSTWSWSSRSSSPPTAFCPSTSMAWLWTRRVFGRTACCSRKIGPSSISTAYAPKPASPRPPCSRDTSIADLLSPSQAASRRGGETGRCLGSAWRQGPSMQSRVCHSRLQARRLLLKCARSTFRSTRPISAIGKTLLHSMARVNKSRRDAIRRLNWRCSDFYLGVIASPSA